MEVLTVLFQKSQEQLLSISISSPGLGCCVSLIRIARIISAIHHRVLSIVVVVLKAKMVVVVIVLIIPPVVTGMIVGEILMDVIAILVVPVVVVVVVIIVIIEIVVVIAVEVVIGARLVSSTPAAPSPTMAMEPAAHEDFRFEGKKNLKVAGILL